MASKNGVLTFGRVHEFTYSRLLWGTETHRRCHRCPQMWLDLWLYWGDHPLMVTPKVSWMVDHRPQLVDLLPPVQNSFSSLPPAPPQPQTSASGVLSCRDPKEQLPDETPKQYFIRWQK